MQYEEKAKVIRTLCTTSTTAAASGHLTSSLSATDLTTVLFEKFFSFDVKNPRNAANDRLIFSKGHASPLFYALWAMAGGFPYEEMQSLRKFGSMLEGHPSMEFPFTEAATGSLGQGLSIGAGMAFVAQKDALPFKTFVLLGDGEMAEGSVWEAANFASLYKLSNLIAIVDVNRLGQSQATMFGHKLEEYERRISSFGWNTIVIDGHNFGEIEKAFEKATSANSKKPTAIIAQTLKGKGISFLEDKDNWHGKALSGEDAEKALKELGNVDYDLKFDLSTQRGPAAPHPHPTSSVASLPARRSMGGPRSASPLVYKKGEQVATREVYGNVLAELADSDPTIYALDGDVKNSTFSQDFLAKHPERFIECFIAEQNMVGVAVGLSRFGKKPFVSTFAAFFTRAFDQIRMARISQANIKFVGSHAGVSIGEDGPSQMGLEDMAMFGTLPDSVVLHPSDAISSSKLIGVMAEHSGISYLRTLRPKTPVIYGNDEEFTIGGSKVLKESKNDMLTIVAAGITVQEALKAAEELEKKKINVRIIDCYSIKPIDKKTLKKATEETVQNLVITVEDHFEHGGLGDFVLGALADTDTHVEKMAVCKISRSGATEELLKDAGIDSSSIVKKVQEFV